jgi:nitrate reductase NapE component
MTQIWQALGLTTLFTIVSVSVVGGIMWLLYIYFNRHLPKSDKKEGEAVSQ